MSLATTMRALRAELRPTLRLSVPLVLAELGWMAMGIVDTIMVGRMPNAAVAIGAISLGQSLYYCAAISGGGVLMGLDTVVANAVGRGDLEDASTWLVNALWLVAVLTPPLMAVV